MKSRVEHEPEQREGGEPNAQEKREFHFSAESRLSFPKNEPSDKKGKPTHNRISVELNELIQDRKPTFQARLENKRRVVNWP